MVPIDRRTLLGALGVGISSVSGCLRSPDAGAESGSIDDGSDGSTGSVTEGPPTVERSLPAAYTAAELVEASQSGGPPPDGIPAIEDPQFAEATDPPALLDDGDPVFGVVLDGEAKAYPQSVLVWHEIVNDVIAGTPVSVTYCPLTGTAQGFRRGETTFGVSGQLINANLVMFDRATETWWPQMLATRITPRQLCSPTTPDSPGITAGIRTAGTIPEAGTTPAVPSCFHRSRRTTGSPRKPS